jgi:uncharacterized protein
MRSVKALGSLSNWGNSQNYKYGARAVLLALALFVGADAMNAQVRRILYLTHSAGFRHDSIEVSKRVLGEIASQSGRLEIVPTEDLAMISEGSLRQFDAVMFFTSGELALSNEQKTALLDFVRAGKGFAGVHSATDTLYGWPEYGEMIGGYFDGHPWVHEVGIDIEDTEHPLVRHLAPSFRITEEIYQFRAFSRARVRVLMTLDTATVDLRAAGVNRTDEDFALAWARPFGNGRVFYTALGHFDSTWLDPRFQTILLNALLWTSGSLEAEGAPRRATPEITMMDDAIAPGSVLRLEGQGLSTGSSAVAARAPLPARLAGALVRFNGIAAPLFEVSPGRIVAQAPYGLNAPLEMTVSADGIDRVTRTVSLAPAVPKIVAVSGGRSTGHLTIYATGLGSVTGDVSPGAAGPSEPLAPTTEQPVVRIDGVASRVLFAGLAPGMIGVYQVNVEWPTQIGTGSKEITLEMANRLSNTTIVE